MLHKDVGLGDNHRIQNWEVANLAALNALTVTADDEGKFARKLDDDTFYFLADSVGPTWTLAIGGQVPPGGAAGEVLAKVSGTNYDTEWVAPGGGGGGGTVIEILTANRTYYVRTDGSDSNTGLIDSAVGAFLTIQKAVDVVAYTVDNAGFTVTIQVRDGTYTDRVLLRPHKGRGIVYIDGNSAAISNVIVSVTSANAFTCNTRGENGWYLRYMEIRTITSGQGLLVQGGTVIITSIVFGACASGHMFVSRDGIIQPITAYTINGAAPRHLTCIYGGLFLGSTVTVTITGTPNFSSNYYSGSFLGVASMVTFTFSGSATGKRYTLTQRGHFFGSASTTYLPGSVAGTASAESFYGLGT